MPISHAEIIARAGGWRVVRAQLGLPKEDTRPKFWEFRNNIPGPYFLALVGAGVATMDELVTWSAAKHYQKEVGKAKARILKARRDNPPKIGRPRKNPAPNTSARRLTPDEYDVLASIVEREQFKVVTVRNGAPLAGARQVLEWAEARCREGYLKLSQITGGKHSPISERVFLYGPTDKAKRATAKLRTHR